METGTSNVSLYFFLLAPSVRKKNRKGGVLQYGWSNEVGYVFQRGLLQKTSSSDHYLVKYPQSVTNT